jgi:hypothetical protein
MNAFRNGAEKAIAVPLNIFFVSETMISGVCVNVEEVGFESSFSFRYWTPRELIQRYRSKWWSNDRVDETRWRRRQDLGILLRRVAADRRSRGEVSCGGRSKRKRMWQTRPIWMCWKEILVGFQDLHLYLTTIILELKLGRVEKTNSWIWDGSKTIWNLLGMISRRSQGRWNERRRGGKRQQLWWPVGVGGKKRFVFGKHCSLGLIFVIYVLEESRVKPADFWKRKDRRGRG